MQAQTNTQANVKAGNNYNSVAAEHANDAALQNANVNSALFQKDASTSTTSTSSSVQVSGQTNANTSANANSEDNLGQQVSTVAKDKTTTGKEKATAVKSEIDSKVNADLQKGSATAADAKNKASVKASANAKTKSNVKSNVQ